MASPTPLTSADVSALLEGHFPLRGGAFEIGPGTTDDGDGFVYEHQTGAVIAVLRPITWGLDEAGEG